MKIIIKWSKNAFREVPKLKIFLPRGRGTLFPWTLSPPQTRLKGKRYKKDGCGENNKMGNRDNILQNIMSGGEWLLGKKWKIRVKFITKWSKNAFREVQKSKIFSPRGRGHPFPWTTSPPHTLSPLGLVCGGDRVRGRGVPFPWVRKFLIFEPL